MMCIGLANIHGLFIGETGNVNGTGYMWDGQNCGSTETGL